MNVSASFYSWKGLAARELAHLLDTCGVDYFHFDCNDDVRVFGDIQTVRQESDTPIDLHIVAAVPDKYSELIQRHRIEVVSFQIDTERPDLTIPRGLGARVGVAMRGDDFDAVTFAPFASTASFVMFTTAAPGRGGTPFDPRTFGAIQQFQTTYPSKHIHVDGGIDAEIASALRSLGVACIVTGSYLASSVLPRKAALSLKVESGCLAHRVEDYMLSTNQLPILLDSEASVHGILEAINRGGLGFVLIIDSRHSLVGLVTDGDVRRALLRHIGDLGRLRTADVINGSCLSLDVKATVADMFDLITSHRRQIGLLPVVDSGGVLVGALVFNVLFRAIAAATQGLYRQASPWQAS